MHEAYFYIARRAEGPLPHMWFQELPTFTGLAYIHAVPPVASSSRFRVVVLYEPPEFPPRPPRARSCV